MTTESGDNKLIGNFRKLIDELTADADYNPANAKLKIPALEAQYATADAAVDAVAAGLAPNKRRPDPVYRLSGLNLSWLSGHLRPGPLYEKARALTQQAERQFLQERIRQLE